MVVSTILGKGKYKPDNFPFSHKNSPFQFSLSLCHEKVQTHKTPNQGVVCQLRASLHIYDVTVLAVSVVLAVSAFQLYQSSQLSQPSWPPHSMSLKSPQSSAQSRPSSQLCSSSTQLASRRALSSRAPVIKTPGSLSSSSESLDLFLLLLLKKVLLLFHL